MDVEIIMDKKTKTAEVRCPNCQRLRTALRRLVEVCKKFNEAGWTQRGWEDLLQKQAAAIAAAEESLK